MKFLFLDIDGVLNHTQWYYSLIDKESKPFPYSCFDPKCVERVNNIIKDTNAKLVISSSWRYDAALWKAISEFGFISGYDLTPMINFASRGEEIQTYINKHECDNYAILDDEDDDISSMHGEHFFQTSAYNGLTDHIANELTKFLK